jgi:hypothetical protein
MQIDRQSVCSCSKRPTKGRDGERLKNRMPETRIFACSRQRILPFLYGTMAVTSLEWPLSWLDELTAVTT